MAIISPTMKPQLTINGSGAHNLVKDRMKAYEALVIAIDALKQTMPHGRDYLINPDAMAQDRDIHFARLALLDGMKNAVMDEAMTINFEVRQ